MSGHQGVDGGWFVPRSGTNGAISRARVLDNDVRWRTSLKIVIEFMGTWEFFQLEL